MPNPEQTYAVRRDTARSARHGNEGYLRLGSAILGGIFVLGLAAVVTVV